MILSSEQKIGLLQALGNNVRLEILKKLYQTQNEVACYRLSEGFDLSQPTMCQHFKKLHQAGVVILRKEKTVNYYTINTVLLEKIGIDIKKMCQE